MPAVPLPPLGDQFQDNEAARIAYQRIIPLENQHTVWIRIIGWMLIHAPLEAGRTDVARSINACQTDEEIFELGKQYLRYFVNYFKAKVNNLTPSPSNHPSRPSVDTIREEIFNTLQEAPTNYSTAKNHALVRDDYCCMLSRYVDFKSLEGSGRLQAQFAVNPFPAAATACAHILPQYINQGITNQDRRDAASQVWTLIRCFGGVPEQELNGNGVQGLRNIMTLRSDLHKDFDQLRIWLDPAPGGVQHQYTLGRIHPALHLDLPNVVTFTSALHTLPLPDRQYLALHAACARVYHMSGAAEFVNNILCDMEQTKVLSEDGSSSLVLDFSIVLVS